MCEWHHMHFILLVLRSFLVICLSIKVCALHTCYTPLGVGLNSDRLGTTGLWCVHFQSSRWLRSSQGSKATTGSQQHPSLWCWDLHPPFCLSRRRQTESCLLLSDSFFAYLSLMENALLRSFAWRQTVPCHFHSFVLLFCCPWFH